MYLKRLSLGSAGFTHIENVLAFENGLCRALLDQVTTQVAAPDVFTFVDDEQRVDVRNLDWSIGKVSTYLPEYLAMLMSQEKGAGLLVFDDAMAQGGDSYLPSNALLVGDEVYHRLSGVPGSGEIGTTIWATAVAWHFVCVFSRRGGAASARESNMLDVKRVAENWDELIVGAFDGEGFVHCRKKIFATKSMKRGRVQF